VRPQWKRVHAARPSAKLSLKEIRMALGDEYKPIMTVEEAAKVSRLAVVGLFAFMASWNNFLGPLSYLQRQEQYTLALGLQAFQSQQGGTDWNLLMAASVLVVLPILVLFFLTQKTFVQGIATTGLK
jgi:multiple sugar transport system permease protein